jgi:hypothetical protein
MSLGCVATLATGVRRGDQAALRQQGRGGGGNGIPLDVSTDLGLSSVGERQLITTWTSI